MGGYLSLKAFKTFSRRFAAGAALAAALLSPLSAAVVTWDGEGANLQWHTASNWSNNAVPTSLDDVTIDTGAVVLAPTTGAPLSFNSLTLGGSAATTLRISTTIASGGALTVKNLSTLEQATTNQLQLGSVTVEPGGKLTHTANSSAFVYSINLAVTGNFDLQTGATIDGTGRGYAKTQGPGAGQNGIWGTASGCAGGGGHAGYGGNASSTRGGVPYGALTDPLTAGSGGGDAGYFCGTPCGPGGMGGAGGGVVRLEVGGTLALAGTVDVSGVQGANSSIASSGGGGGGAAGSVDITAVNLNGSGSISANGGSGSYGSNNPANYRGGGGSGGRVAIKVSGSDTSQLSISAAAGPANTSWTYIFNGAAGTVYRKAPGQANFSLSLGGAVAAQSSTTVSGSLVIDTLTVTNAWPAFGAGDTVEVGTASLTGWSALEAGALELAGEGLGVAGNSTFTWRVNTLALAGSINFGGRSTITWTAGGTVSVPPGKTITFQDNSSVTWHFGRVELPDSSSLILGAGKYTLHGATLSYAAGGLTVPAGAVVSSSGTAQLDIMGDLDLQPGAVWTHLANGAARSHVLDLYVGGDFTLQAGATITVSGRGYGGGNYSAGKGPGAGAMGGTTYRGGGGGGYGGYGGTGYATYAGGAPYGDAALPAEPGSGGGSGGAAGGTPGTGGAGGGAVALSVAGTLSLSGSVDASGSTGGNGSGDGGGGGGGSGGSIYISAAALTGSGTLSAYGGSGGSNSGNYKGGGGAGGRLSLSAPSCGYSGAINIGGASGYVWGSTGTWSPSPSGLSSPGQAYSSLDWSWTGACGAAAYMLVPASSTSTVAAITPSSATAYTETGLARNSGYGRRVAGYNNGFVTALSESATAYTHASVPNAFTNYVWLADHLGLDWDEDNPAGTLFRFEVSTAADFNPALSSVTLNTAAVIADLIPNTTYYRRVRAQNSQGVDTAWAEAEPLATRVRQPRFGAAIPGAQLTYFWDANGNPDGTYYEVAMSTDGFSTVIAVPVPFSALHTSTTAVLAPLAPNEMHSFKARATGHSGNISSYDTPATALSYANSPSSAAVNFSGAGQNGFTVSWGANGNPDSVDYGVYLSTSPSFDGDDDIAQNLSSLSYSPFSLASNTTYYARISAINSAAVATDWLVLGSTATLPAEPGAGIVTGLGVSSVTVTWERGANPADSSFLVQVSSVSWDYEGRVPQLTGATTAVFTGLLPNTTYYARVKTVGRDGVPGPAADISGARTWAALPLPEPVSFVSATEATLNWGFNDNPPGTVFEAYLSTAADMTGTLIPYSGDYDYHPFSGLASNALYHGWVRALGVVPSTYAYLGSTITFCALPVPQGAGTPSTAAFTLAWVSGGNSTGTPYAVSISTYQDFSSVLASTSTTQLSAAFGGLTPNTTYYGRVKAVGSTPSDYAYFGAVVTPPAQPTNANVAGGNSGMLGIGWGTGGNPSGTRYWAEISTSADHSGATGWETTFTNTGFAGLSPNTTYYARVKALGSVDSAYAVISATSTLAAAPGAGQGLSLGVSSAAAAWADGGNPAGTLYRVHLSTSEDYTPYQQRETTAAWAFFDSLSPNTTYYPRVAAVGHGGTATDFTVLAATRTLPAVPAPQPFSSLMTTFVILNWGSNGNPAGTNYEAKIATSPDFSDGVTSYPSDNYVPYGLLTPDTTYYARVRALGLVPSAYADLGSTVTLSAPPAAVSFSSAGTSSATMSWTANGNPSWTPYSVQISTDPGFGVSTQAAAGAALSYAFSGLAPNTTYFGRALAAGTLPSAWSSAVSTTTAAMEPGPAIVSPLGVSSAALIWIDNGNPADTLYYAEISTDPALEGTLLSSGPVTGTSAVFTGLGGNTAYFGRVRALGHNGAYSDYTGASFGITLPAVPWPLQHTQINVSSVTLGWGSNNNRAGTTYTAQLSAAADFSGAVSTSTTGNFATFTGLSANTTYYLRVKAHGTEDSAYAAIGSTMTMAAVPSAGGIQAVAVYTVRTYWSDAANPAGTLYRSQLSTSTDFGAVWQELTDQHDSTFSALTPNTTYYGRVAAYNGLGVAGPYVALGSTWTPAQQPSGLAFTAAHVSSLTFAWSGGDNPAWTTYEAHLSTVPGYTEQVSFSTLSAGTAASFTGITPNTTYYARVRAMGPVPTDYLFGLSTATYAAAPVSAALLPVGVSSLTFGWGAAGNPDHTDYRVELSTSADYSASAVQHTSGTALTFQGLFSSTLYYARVKALGPFGSETAYAASSTATFTSAPSAGGLSGVTESALSLAWGANSNPAGMIYQAQASTAADYSVAASSFTTGLGAAFSGLAADSTYYLRVRVNNGSALSAWTALGSTVTLAVQPSGAAFVAVTSAAVTLAWSAGSNPAWTTYQVQRAGEAGFVSPVAALVSTPAYTAQGLAASSTYYFRVRALNGAGTYTAFDGAVSTATLPPSPGKAARPSGVALGVSSVSWSWAALANAAYYRVYPATAPADLLASPAALSFVREGLLPNTTYSLVAAGVNATGAGELSPPAAPVATLAYPPASPASAAVQVTSAVISWGLNSNPAATTARLERSTDNASFSEVFAGAALSYTDRDLLACTSYYYRVRNTNIDGLHTAYASAPQFFTQFSTPAAPGALYADPLAGNRVRLTWEEAPAEGITAYAVYYDSGTGSVDYGAPLAVLSSTATAYTTAVLPSTASYRFGLRARNRCGREETNTSLAAYAPSLASLTGVKAAIKIPQPGRKVWGDRVTVVAELTLGDEFQVREVRFQRKMSTEPASAWADVPAATALNHPNPDDNFPYFVHWDVTGLPAGDYDLRAVARDTGASDDAAPAAVTVSVGSSDPDISETTLGGGSAQKVQKINNLVPNTLQAADEDSLQFTRLEIPAGALSLATMTVTVVNSPSDAPAAPAEARSANVVAKIELSDSQTVLAGGRTAAVTLAYPDEDGDGVLDGTAIAVESLKIFTAPTSAGPWRRDFSSTLDRSARTVTGRTSHFSFFGLFAAAEADLSGLEVYPVPFVPGDGNTDNGVAYSASDPNSGIIFDKLPASVKIEIYTVSGRPVAKFSSANSTGKLQWDVKNDDGKDAATGGYIAVITGPGGSAVRKLVVIR